MKRRRMWSWVCVCLMVGVVASARGTVQETTQDATQESVVEQRPGAPELLPESTLIYFRIADSRELASAFRDTSMGRIGQDEEIQPIIQHLWGSMQNLFAEAEAELGISLDQLLELPQGEICFAVIGREQGEPAFAAIVEVGDSLPTALKLLQRAEQEAVREGATIRTEEANDVLMTIMQTPDEDAPDITYFEREQTFIFTSDTNLAKEILSVWDGASDVRTLSDNPEFRTIMRKSSGTRDERPQISFFADPIEMVKHATRGNVGAQIAMTTFLPTLGLNGLKSVGGSIIFAPEEFDSIMHFHVMLDNPRRGVIKAVALESGDPTPEPWVPIDCASYTTLFWDARTTYETVAGLVDSFRGEGSLARLIESRLGDELDIDFERDVLDQFGGRVTLVNWFERPMRLNSQTTLLGVKLEDADAFRSTLDRVVVRVGDGMRRESYRGQSFWMAETNGNQPPNVDAELLRQPEICLAIVGDYLIFSDSEACFKAAIDAKNNSEESLAEELDFKLIASRIREHSQGVEPSLMSFDRPEESMRMIYELATAPEMRQMLASQADSNPVLGALHEALTENELPPFSRIAEYLAPTGGMIISDETGIHYTAFSLRRE